MSIRTWTFAAVLALSVAVALGQSQTQPQTAPADPATTAPTASAPATRPADPTPVAPVATAPAASEPAKAPTSKPASAPAKNGKTASAPASQPVRNIQFSYGGMPFNDVIRIFADKAAHKPLLGDFNVEGNLTFHDSDPYSYDEAFDLLNLLLSMRGWTIQDTGRYLTVKRLDQARPKYVTEATTQDVRPSELVSMVLPLKFIDANTAARVASEMSKTASIAALPKGKGILVVDRMENINFIRKMLSVVDTGEMADQQLKTYVLKKAPAAGVADIINSLFGPNRPRRMVWNPEQNRFTPDAGDRGEFVTANADPRTNLLFLIGTGDKLAMVEQMIEKLDADAPLENGEVRIFELKNARADEVANTIRQLQPQPNPAAKIKSAPARVVSDAATNSLIVSAAMDQMQTIEKLIKDIDLKTVARSGAKIFRLQFADAQQISPIVSNLGAKRDATGRSISTLSVGVDSRTNTLIVSGNAGDVEEAGKLITELDQKDVAKDSREIRVIQLKAGDARQLADSLRRLFEQQGPAHKPGQGGLRVEADGATNSLIVAAGPADWPTIQDILQKLEASVVPNVVPCTKVIALKNAKATDLAQTLRTSYANNQHQNNGRPSMAPPVAIACSERTNCLLISAGESDQKLLSELVLQLDVPLPEAGGPTSFDPVVIVRLKSVDAQKLAQTLQSLVPKAPGQDIQIQPDPSNSVLLIRAPEAQRKMLEEIVSKVDEETLKVARMMRTIKLKGASAQAMGQMLNQLYQNVSAAQHKGRGPAVDPSTEAVIVTAGPDDKTLIIDAPKTKIDSIVELATSLDIEQAPGKMEIRTYQLANSAAAEAAPSLARLFAQQQARGPGQANVAPEPQPRFEADNATNQLLVAATPKQFELIEELVKKINTQVTLASQTKTFRLKSARAPNVVSVLQTMLTEGDRPGRKSDVASARVAALGDGNAVIVQGLPEKLALAEQLIKTLDDEQAVGLSIQIVPLKNAQARTLADALTQTLNQQSAGQPRRPGEVDVTVTPEPNSNSLLVRGTVEKVQSVLEMVRKLDGDGAGVAAVQVKTYTLQNSDAAELAKSIEKFFRDMTTQTRRATGEPPPFSISADTRTNSLFVSTTVSNFAVLENLLKKLDETPDRPYRDAQYFWLVNADPTDVAAKVNAMFADRKGADKPVVESDSFSSAVTVIAKDADLKSIEQVIDKLDQQAKGTNLRVRVIPLSQAKADRMALMLQRVYSQMTDAQIDVTEKLPRPTTQSGASVEPGMPEDLFNDVVPRPTTASAPARGELVVRNLTPNEPTSLPASGPATSSAPAGTSGKPRITIAVDRTSNSLIVSGTRQDIENIQALVDQLANTADKETDFRAYTLKNADPSMVSRVLTDLFNPKPTLFGGPTAGQPRSPRTAGPGLPNIPTGPIQPAQVIPGGPPVIMSVADVRTKTLFVRAKPLDFDVIEAVIKMLDQPAQVSTEVKVFVLKNADATEVATNIRDLFQAAAQGRGNGRNNPNSPLIPQDVRTEMIQRMIEMQIAGGTSQVQASNLVTASANRNTNSVVVSASTGEMELIGKIIQELDQTAADTRQASVRMYVLKQAEVNSAVAALQQLFVQPRQGPRGQSAADTAVVITGDEAGRMIMVSATADKHELIAKVIKELDAAQATDPMTVKVYRLQHADASGVAAALSNVLTTGTTGQPARRPGQGQSGQTRISADPSSGSLVVRASKDEHERIAKLVLEFDVAPGSQYPVQTIPLANADASNVAAILTKLFASQPQRNRPGQTGNLGSTILIEGDKDSRLLTVRADDETFQKIRTLAAQLDAAPPAGQAQPTVLPLKNAQAVTVAAVLQQAFNQQRTPGAKPNPDDQVTVVGEPNSNSVIITATAKRTQQVVALLEKLDVDTETGAKTEFLILKNAKSADLATALSKFSSPTGQGGPRRPAGQPGGSNVVISADSASNALIFSGPSLEVEKMIKLAVKLDDSSVGGVLETKVIALKNGQANSVATALTSAFAPAKAIKSKPEDTVTAVGEAGSNTLLVTASAANMKKVEELVKVLDTETAGGMKSEIVLLKNAKAVDLSGVLSKVAANTLKSKTGPNQPQTVVSGDAGSNALVFSGPAGDMEKLVAMAKQIDEASTSVVPAVYMIQLKNGDAVTMAAMVRDLFTQATKGTKTPDPLGVTADERANALVLATTKEMYEKVSEWVNKLEEMKPARGNLRLIPVPNADPSEVEKAIRTLYNAAPGPNAGGPAPRRPNQGGNMNPSGSGRVETTLLPGQKAILINANDEDYAEIMALVKKMEEAAQASKREIKIFTLKNASNTKVAAALDLVFKQTAPKNATVADLVTVQALAQTNAVVVAAAKDKLAEIGSLIEQLDKQENSPQVEYRIYPLTNASPTKALPMLRQLIAPMLKMRPDEPINVEADERTKSIIVSARAAVFDQIGKIIETIDKAPAADVAKGNVLFIQLKHADAKQLATVLSDMLKPDAAGQVTADARALQEQIRLLNIKAGDAEKLPQLDLTKPIKITADAGSTQGSNTLIVNSTEDNLKALKAIVETLDVVPLAEGVVMRLVHLQNSDAGSIVTVLKDIFTQGKTLGGKQGTSVAGRAEPASDSGKALVNPLNISADPRTNTLILSGIQETVALAEILVKDLDRNEGKFVTEVRLFRLKNADAVKMVPVLSAVFAEAAAVPGSEGIRTQVTRLKTVIDKQQGSETALPKGRAALVIQADSTTNILIVAARNDVMPLIADVVVSMDVPGAGSLNTVRIFPLENADATRLQTVITSLYTGPNAQNVRAEDKPTLSVDTRTNALIVAASEKTFALIETLLKKLDAKLPVDLRDIRLVPLKNAEAATLATSLQRMMDARVQRLATMSPKESEALKVIILSDPRSNSLMVGGSAEGFDIVKTLAEQLDGANPALGGQVQMFVLTNGNAATITTSLTNLFNQRYAAATTPGVARQKPIIVADLRTNSLLVAANEDDSKILKNLLEKLDVKLADATIQLVVIPLKYNDSGSVGATIRQIFTSRLTSMTPPGTTPDPANRVDVATEPLSNALIISASKENIEMIKGLLEKVDAQPPAESGIVKIYTLKIADATATANLLQGLIKQGLYKPSVTSAANNPAVAAREKVSIVSDIRTNTIIVSASKENMAVIEQILKEVDTDVAALMGDVRIYNLARADASKLAPMLQQFFSAKRQGEMSVNNQLKTVPVVVVADTRTNSLLVTGGKESFASVEEMIKKLDGDTATSINDFKVFYLKNATAAAIQPMLQQLFNQRVSRGQAVKDPITIVADPKNNALVVGATIEDMKLAETLISKLDVPETNATAVQVFALRKANATSVANTIKGLMATQATGAAPAAGLSISVDERTNSLIVSAGASDMERIKDLVSKLDQDTVAKVSEIRVYNLQNADAKELALVLTDVLTSKPKAPIPDNSNRQQLLQFITHTKEGKDLIASALQEGVTITPDTRTNSLVLSAPLESMPLLDSLVKALDQTSPRIAEIRMFALQNADARQMSDVLMQLFRLQAAGNGNNNNKVSYTLVPSQANGSGKPNANGGPFASVAANGNNGNGNGNSANNGNANNGNGNNGNGNGNGNNPNNQPQPMPDTNAGGDQNGSGGPSVAIGNADNAILTVTVDIRTNSLLVGGSRQYVDLASKVIEDLDSSPAQERKNEVYRLRNARANDVQQALQTFLDRERQKIAQTLGTNGVGAAIRLLEQEVAVVAVPSENKPENSNTLLLSASPRYFDTVKRIIMELDQPPSQVLVQVLLAEVTLDETCDLGMDAMYTRKVDESTVSGGTNFQTAAEISKFDGFSVSVTGGDIRFFLRALATQGKLEVLSRPMVLASDNQKAVINVGDEVAFITDSRINDNGTTYNTVQYRPVGITLTVTPRINPDGLVKMEVNPKISALSTSSVTISPGVNAPIINSREANTTVSVQDGHTMVLGGLVTTKDENREEKVPVLGDIPLLGNLFKKTNKVKERKELLIILTPHVVRTGAQADCQTDKELDRFNKIMQKSNLQELHKQMEGGVMSTGCPTSGPAATDSSNSSEVSRAVPIISGWPTAVRREETSAVIKSSSTQPAETKIVPVDLQKKP